MVGKAFRPAAKVIKKIDKLHKVMKSLQTLETVDVLVGVPQADSSRSGQDVTNAELMFLHEHGFKAPKWAVLKAYRNRYQGNDAKQLAIDSLQMYFMSKGSPFFRVPARPWLEPAIEANMDGILKLQVKTIQEALKGNTAGVITSAKRLGMYAQSVVKNWAFDSRNNWAPNHPLIVKIKGSDRPLIDTGALLNSIHYVVMEGDTPV